MRRGAIMNFTIQDRYCHAERSEASLCPSRETLRFAQGDNTVPMLVVKKHYRASTSLPEHHRRFVDSRARIPLRSWLFSLPVAGAPPVGGPRRLLLPVAGDLLLPIS